MTLENEMELRHTYDTIARMYELGDRIAADTTGLGQTRRAEVEGVNAMIQKLERQIADFLAGRPEKAA